MFQGKTPWNSRFTAMEKIVVAATAGKISSSKMANIGGSLSSSQWVERTVYDEDVQILVDVLSSEYFQVKRQQVLQVVTCVADLAVGANAGLSMTSVKYVQNHRVTDLVGARDVEGYYYGANA